jgi:DNA-binding Lrp family transcriptional regulator
VTRLTELEDMRARIASKLGKLHTLDELTKEIPSARQGNGWDPSRIVETTSRIEPQPLDRLVRKATRPGILQRIADLFRPVSAMSRLAGPPTIIYFPLWHLKGYHECFYLREAKYRIRVDKDVVAVEVDGETRDLMIEEQENASVPDALRRTLKRFSRLFMGERRYFNLNDVIELALRRARTEMYVTFDGQEGTVLDEALPSRWKTRRIFSTTDLNVEGMQSRIAVSRETKETVVRRLGDKLVRMPEESKQILSNTFQIDELTEYYIPFVHFPVKRGGRVDQVVITGASAETPDSKTVASVRRQLGL